MTSVLLRRRRRAPEQAALGFTLIELAVVLSLVGIVSAIAVPSFRRYENSQRLIGGTRDVVSLMRHAQASAVSNSATARVDISSGGATVTEYLTDATGAFSQVGRVDLSNGVSVGSYAFTARVGGTSPSLYFYSRGTATTGTATVLSNTGAQHVISVEGVTGRVSYR